MKKLILVAAVAFLFSTTTNAQEPKQKKKETIKDRKQEKCQQSKTS
jgi:hypothetical protein